MPEHQRRAIAMTPAEVDTYLAERHHATVCSLNHDGSIHAVAMWYGFLDGRLAVHTKAKSQKVQNLRRNGATTWLVESGTRYEELRGVELVGHAEIVEDPGRLFSVGASVYGRYLGPYTDEARPFVEETLQKRVAIVLSVTRTVSWDHRKLADRAPR
ncbi:MAG: pyridoxamine 5'-phosphate oxidase family protein [Acidimicrobiales bacterium]